MNFSYILVTIIFIVLLLDADVNINKTRFGIVNTYIPLNNVTIYVPIASKANGKGNFELPSGRRIHAFNNVELRLSESRAPLGIILTIRCNSEEGEASVMLEDEEGLALATRKGWLWNTGDAIPRNIYFAIDDLYDDAFIHWILECGVFLDYWTELKTMFPQLTLILRQPKKYKKLFFPVFGVDPNDVEYYSGGWPVPSEPYTDLIFPDVPSSYPLPNLVFFPPGQYAHDSLLDFQLFYSTRSSFVDRVMNYSRSSIENNKDRSVLILPRGKTDNLVSNDRVIQELDILAMFVDTGQFSGAKVFRTDNMTDIRNQVNELAQAKVIFVGAGSAAYFNVLFAKNAIVHVLGPERIKSDSTISPMFRLTWELASKSNTFIIHEYGVGENELKALLLSSISS